MTVSGFSRHADIKRKKLRLSDVTARQDAGQVVMVKGDEDGRYIHLFCWERDACVEDSL